MGTCTSVAGLAQNTRKRDTPTVVLIKDNKCHRNVQVFSGRCLQCDTIFYADHDSAVKPDDHLKRTRTYYNSAVYLKVGQKLWVDRQFSKSVVNAVYSFHASTAAITSYWNESFEIPGNTFIASRRQIWQAFVQETVCQVASSSNMELALDDGLPINDVTRLAFAHLGENGIVRSAEGHHCSECTHAYKDTADHIVDDNDDAGMVGVDEGRGRSSLRRSR
ncbi:hypothetical protein HGRIS_010756 [Hohenbuehelia grisea]|uniref:CxC5 like cysteine cluster associated with KDZ domain-containing protein n=1 Tax=Hohenbuehelia grisea TaxID=104357 RepID=A0ABR3IY68_9AGAR